MEGHGGLRHESCTPHRSRRVAGELMETPEREWLKTRQAGDGLVVQTGTRPSSSPPVGAGGGRPSCRGGDDSAVDGSSVVGCS
eukprot:5583939-Prymnesium_polylepis.1